MRLTAAALLATATAFPVTAQATAVTFSSAVATFHQTFDRDWSPSEMIDGITSGSNGWAIYDANTGTTEGQSSVLTLATPLAAGSYDLTFTITQNYGDVHTLGDFGLLYLTDATPTLASPTLFFTNLPSRRRTIPARRSPRPSLKRSSRAAAVRARRSIPSAPDSTLPRR